ncbi:hypothetical protein GCM10029992_54080 [Glycomyces albus]
MPAKSPLPADTPLLAVVGAISALGLAAILVFASLPSEERSLMYQGAEVSPAATCGTVDESAPVLCAEVGTYETRRSGWQVPTLVAAGVLTALSAVVLATLPRHARDRRRRREMAREFRKDLPDESEFGGDPLRHFDAPDDPHDGPRKL